MAFIIYGAILLLTLILQTTLFPAFPFLGVYPDLIVVIVIIFAIFNGPVFGAKFGLLAGLLLDILTGQLIGLGALTKMTAGIASGFVGQRFFKENYLIAFSSVLVMSFADQLLYLIGMFIFGLSVSWTVAFTKIVVPVSIYNAIIGIIIYRRLYYFNLKIQYWDELAKRTG
ncbi:MAG: rod shape-determining protein MreD [Firmicutes bacterium]|nr:rod shape-determining protein MreD [Bacillota bacterium]